MSVGEEKSVLGCAHSHRPKNNRRISVYMFWLFCFVYT